MTTLAALTDKTLQAPRMKYSVFLAHLKSRPAPPEVIADAAAIWDKLVVGGVEPAFALGVFWAESNYGTNGFAAVTHSWANILWDAQWTPTRKKKTFTLSSGATYTYASYSTFLESIDDYVAYVRRYAVTVDSRYGDSSTIDGCTARWVGDAKTSLNHLTYVSTVIAQMDLSISQSVSGFIETGDKMIFAGKALVSAKARYPIVNGMNLYRGTDGTLLKMFQGTDGLAMFFGPVNQPWADTTWSWGLVRIKTSVADPDGTLCYIKNPMKSKVTFVSTFTTLARRALRRPENIL